MNADHTRAGTDASFSAVVAPRADVVVVMTLDGRIEWVNGALQRVFGVPAEDAVGSSIAELIHVADRGAWVDWLSDRWDSVEPAAIVVRGAHRDGRHPLIEASAVGRREPHAGGRVVVTIREASERGGDLDTTRSMTAPLSSDGPDRDRLREYHDVLGRLADLALSAGSRADDTGRAAHVLVVKVGNLGGLVAHHGLRIVQPWLHDLAQEIRAIMADGDLVAVGRLGEIAIVTAAMLSEREADGLAARVVALGSEAGHRPAIELGIGVARVSPTDAPIATLHRAIAAAERACAAAAGLRLDGDVHRAAAPSAAAHRLERALDPSALEFEPVRDLRSGMIAGFEVVLRWDRDSLDTIEAGPLPSPAADATAMLDIARFQIAEGCAHLARWQDEVGHDDAPHLIVSLSVLQFRDGWISRELAAQIDRSGADPTGLCIKLTDTAALDRQPETVADLTEFRELGVTIAVDAFGTGYSSLQHLRVVDADVLTIDRRLVERLGIDDGATAMVRAAIELAASLEMTTIAEGVRTADDEDQLDAMGCTHVQGPHVGVTVSGPAALELVRSTADLPPGQVAEVLRAHRALDAIDDRYRPSTREVAVMSGADSDDVRRVLASIVRPMLRFRSRGDSRGQPTTA